MPVSQRLIEEHRRLPCQDVFHQSRLADLTRAENDADLVAGENFLQRLLF